jgi:hypothetical protein
MLTKRCSESSNDKGKTGGKSGLMANGTRASKTTAMPDITAELLMRELTWLMTYRCYLEKFTFTRRSIAEDDPGMATSVD